MPKKPARKPAARTRAKRSTPTVLPGGSHVRDTRGLCAIVRRIVDAYGQTATAAKLGATERTVWAWVNNRRVPTSRAHVERIERVARALGK